MSGAGGGGREKHGPHSGLYASFAARRAVWRKELRESRAAALVGLVVFLALPAFWVLLYATLISRGEILPGVAGGLWMGFGWLFAAVLGAQVVCRDLGRREGEFMLARPVRAGELLRIKGWAGFWIVAALAALVVTAEAFVPQSIAVARVGPERALVVIAQPLLSYWVAFAAAALLRQMLPSVLAAGLAVALFVIGPWVSAVHAEFSGASNTADWRFRWALLHALAGVLPGFPERLVLERWGGVFEELTVMIAALSAAAVATAWIVGASLFRVLAYVRPRPGASILRALGFVIVFLLLYRLAIVAGPVVILLLGFAAMAAEALLGVAIAASERRWNVRLNQRGMAWVVAVAAVAVFATALGQVGRNRLVDQTIWRAVNGLSPIVVGSTRLAIGPQVQDLDEAQLLFDPLAPGIPFTAHFLTATKQHEWGYSSTHLGGFALPVFDESDELYAIHEGSEFSAELGHFVQVLHFSHVDRVTNQIDRTTTFPSSFDECEFPVPVQAAIRDGRLHVAWQMFQTVEIFAGEENEIGELRETGAVLEEFAVEADFTLTAVWMRRLPYLTRPWTHGGWRLRGGAMPQRWDGVPYVRAGKGFYDASGPDSPPTIPGTSVGDDWVRVDVLIQDGVSVGCDSSGLVVLRNIEPRESASPRRRFATAEVVGRANRGMFGWATAEPRELLSGADGLVWEISEESVRAYDLSDLARPRLIAHIGSYPIADAVAGPGGLVLMHPNVGISIVRDPRVARD